MLNSAPTIVVHLIHSQLESSEAEHRGSITCDGGSVQQVSARAEDGRRDKLWKMSLCYHSYFVQSCEPLSHFHS